VGPGPEHLDVGQSIQQLELDGARVGQRMDEGIGSRNAARSIIGSGPATV
jgi:hypothetical protein